MQSSPRLRGACRIPARDAGPCWPATEEGVPIPVISAALFGRFASRGNADYANRILSAMRKQFGGHDEKPEAIEMIVAHSREPPADALVIFGVTGAISSVNAVDGGCAVADRVGCAALTRLNGYVVPAPAGIVLPPCRRQNL